ncbi:pyridoxal-phosphate dependent enzyme [Vibrio lentus]|uniref:cysteine synthase n=1 Tax=Vibrio lentus TaxID=136468 RepID=A0A2N7BSZ0_9VIBR|nr:pyridoxal-phosphate dependent enzyme [Vibrio lentus]PME54316.1 hypothetical protein BCV34_05045 [Vibrio lentus]PME62910.1 hypothetical protein BCV30_09845 [Vibrio lentus]PME77622.1 hypothetical protein BCV27_18800 [Vibrio lentus]PMG76722.1 hypothetical protein BCU86_02560 [Vibrio lentus]PMH92307.1 hypothetical protein BCU56_01015 [Vibrio lentus]
MYDKQYSPLISGHNIAQNLWLKLEYKNPSLSMKHRCIPEAITKRHVYNDLQGINKLAIVSAGCAGISLAWIAKRLGYSAIIIVPVGTASSVIDYCKWLGAEVMELEPEKIPVQLERMQNDRTTYFFDQLNDPNLPQHYQAVGAEILEQNPDVDVITVAAGTAASAMGIAEAAKEKGVKVYVVEPAESRVLAGYPWKPHRIPGLAPPIKTTLFDKKKITDLIGINSELAWQMSQEIQQKTGEAVGPSSGATVLAAQQLLTQGKAHHIAAICASHIAISL